MVRLKLLATAIAFSIVTGQAQETFSIGTDASFGTFTIDQTYSASNNGIYNRLAGNVNGGTVYGINNYLQMTGTIFQTGIVNNFSGAGSGSLRGFQNQFLNTGNGSHTGFSNTFGGNNAAAETGFFNYFSAGSGNKIGLQNLAPSGFTLNGSIQGVSTTISTPGSGTHYGINNQLLGTGAGTKYGSYNFIHTNAGGTHYGIYSEVLKSGANTWAGYFLGDVSIGTTTGNIYTFPASRGTNNQVMLSDGSGNVSWVNSTSIQVAHKLWRIQNTTNDAIGVGNDMYHTGEVGIGDFSSGTIQAPLHVLSSSVGPSYSAIIENTDARNGLDINISGNTPTTGRTALKIDNTNTGGAAKSGIDIDMNGSGSGYATAVTNHFLASSTYTGVIRGVYNDIDNNSNGYHYGTINDISGTGTGNKYGTYTNIDPSAGGTHYGIYSEVTKASSYSGYFLGNVAIGTNGGNIYTMPASRGTNNQIIQTDGTGNLSWVNPSAISSDDPDWYEVGTTSAPTAITDDIYHTGRVGIGSTTSPSSSLYVRNAAASDFYTGYFNYSGSANTPYLLYLNEEGTGLGSHSGIYLRHAGTHNQDITGFSVATTNNGSGDHVGFSASLASGSGGNKTGLNLNIAGSQSNTGIASYISGTSSLTQIGLNNSIVSTTSSVTYAIANSMTGTGTGEKRGLYNAIQGGNGIHYGTYSYLQGTGIGQRFGSYIRLSGTPSSGTSPHYGHYSLIQSGGSGPRYGSFNYMGGSSSGISIGSYNIVENSSASASKYGTYNFMNQTNGNQICGLYNSMSGTGGSSQYAIYNEIRNAGTALKYGVYNEVSFTTSAQVRGFANNITTTSTNAHYGVHNNVSGAGSGDRYSIYNTMSGSGTGHRFGTYTTITGSSSTDEHYGSYTSITSSGTANKYGSSTIINPGSGSGNLFGDFINMAGISSGTVTADHKLIQTSGGTDLRGDHVQFLNASAPGAIKYGQYNQYNSSGSGSQFGFYNQFENSGAGWVAGLYNGIFVTGSGNKYGVLNDYGSSATATSGNFYGVYNSLGSAVTSTSSKYGLYNNFPASIPGTHFGVYSDVTRSGSYSGFFLGNVYVGTTTANGYILPTTDGTNTYVMQTNGSGQANWVDPSTLFSSYWTRNAGDLYPSTLTDNVGIGINNPTARLHVTGGRVEFDNATDASGTTGTGVLEIGNTLRLDGNEIITNSNTTLSLQYDNNGDLDVDAGTLRIDASADRVGINTTTPSSTLNINSDDEIRGINLDYDYTAGASTVLAILGDVDVNSASSVYTYGIYGDVNKIANATNVGHTYGIYGRSNNRYTGSTGSNAYGVYGYGLKYTGTNGNAYGGYFLAYQSAAGTASYGLYASYSGAATTEYSAYFAGNTYCTGAYQTSDEKLKSGISPLTTSLDRILELPVKSYAYKTNEYDYMNLPEGEHAGFLAQEVEQVFPELVKSAVQPASDPELVKEGLETEHEEVHFKALNYTGLIPHLVRATQEQQELIDENAKVKAENKELRNKMDALRARIEAIEARLN